MFKIYFVKTRQKSKDIPLFKQLLSKVITTLHLINLDATSSVAPFSIPKITHAYQSGYHFVKRPLKQIKETSTSETKPFCHHPSERKRLRLVIFVFSNVYLHMRLEPRTHTWFGGKFSL